MKRGSLWSWSLPSRGAGVGILVGTPYRMGKTSDGYNVGLYTMKKNIKTSSLYLPKTIVHSAKPVFTNGSRYRSTGGPIL